MEDKNLEKQEIIFVDIKRSVQNFVLIKQDFLKQDHIVESETFEKGTPVTEINFCSENQATINALAIGSTDDLKYDIVAQKDLDNSAMGGLSLEEYVKQICDKEDTVVVSYNSKTNRYEQQKPLFENQEEFLFYHEKEELTL